MARKKAVKKEENVTVTEKSITVEFTDGETREFLPPQDSFENIDNPVLFGDTTTSIDSKAPVEPLQEDVDLSTTIDTPEAENVPEGFLEAMDKVYQEEVVTGLVTPYVKRDQDDEEPVIPEYYVFDHADIPQPAIRVDIREPKLDTLVRKVLEIAYLGGELYPQGIQLGRVPYRVSMLIREDKYEAYTNGEGVAKINDNALEVVVKGKDSGNFLKRLIEVGKGGAAIQDQRQVSKTGVYAAPLLTNTPVTASASISTGVKKPIYTVDDLKGFSAQQLKIVCNWYSLSYRGKVQARIDIVEKQKEIKSGER